MILQRADIMSFYCENCGAELNSLFCENCGSISMNLPNSLSNDDSLAGLLANVINQGKSLLFSQINSLTNSSERAYRIFSQLEKTRNFHVVKQSNDYIITVNANNVICNDTFSASDSKIELFLLKALLELFPLDLEEINTFSNSNFDIKVLKKTLGKNFDLITTNGKIFFEKRDHF